MEECLSKYWWTSPYYILLITVSIPPYTYLLIPDDYLQLLLTPERSRLPGKPHLGTSLGPEYDPALAAVADWQPHTDSLCNGSGACLLSRAGPTRLTVTVPLPTLEASPLCQPHHLPVILPGVHDEAVAAGPCDGGVWHTARACSHGWWLSRQPHGWLPRPACTSTTSGQPASCNRGLPCQWTSLQTLPSAARLQCTPCGRPAYRPAHSSQRLKHLMGGLNRLGCSDLMSLMVDAGPGHDLGHG